MPINKFFSYCRPADDIEKISDKYGNTYYNDPCALDIETSSYINANGEKRATMYIWQMCIFGVNFYGRTYHELLTFIKMLKNVYSKNGEQIIVYVHNLPYDSHFILKWLNITKMFATDIHEPLYFIHDNFLQFKCSLKLSQKKLAKLAEYASEISDKITGYDYNKIRHSKTPLTDDELLYCETDIIIIYQYIRFEMSQNDNDITKIPLTATGYARRFCRNKCNDNKYHNWIKICTPIDPDLYAMLHRAFTGGITHANAIYCDMLLEDITNYDLQSDYPAQVVKNKYPSTPFLRDNISKFPNDENIAVLADVIFINLRSKYTHSILSFSKCAVYCPHKDINIKYVTTKGHRILNCRNCPRYNECKQRLEIDNGRIISAGYVQTTITEIDFYNISLMYDFDNYIIQKAYTAEKDFLPRNFVMCVLKLYSDKTAFKNVPEKETEYKLSKALLNAASYGMNVTNIVHDIIEYTPENIDMWQCIKNNDVETELKKYQQSRQSFLLYQTGIYITAFARRDLVETISEICNCATDTINNKPFDDIVYYDTDSIKLLNGEKYKHIFDSFNRKTYIAMKHCSEYHNIKFDFFNPKDKNGVSHLLGIFDIEQPYKYFKTLGAKRYVYCYDNDMRDFHITIAGVNKKTGAKYLCELAEQNQNTPFDNFNDTTYFPAGKCGKKTLFYSDTGFEEDLTDYLGNVTRVCEKSFIHMGEADYNLSILDDFKHLFTKYHDGGF